MEKEINARCRRIKETDLEMIMNWRMRPDITQYLNTDPKLTLEGQKKWLETIQKSDTDLYWMLEVDDVPAGVVSLIGYDGRQVHTGGYIAEKSKSSIKLAIYLQWNLYRYSFEKLQVHKVCEEVFSENSAVVRMMDMCGSKREGELRHHVYKNEKYYDVIIRGILADEWMQMKPKLKYDIIEFENKDGTEYF